MYKLRDYQLAAVDAIFNYFIHSDGNPLIALPTGTGKSLVIAEFLKRIFTLYPNQRILKLTHVKELIQQNYEKLIRHWPTAPCGVYSAGLGVKDVRFPVTFGGVQSVVNNVEAFEHIDLVIIDEAHLVSQKTDSMYQSVLYKLREVNPQLKVIGLTATHYRMGQGLLTNDGIFTDVAFDLTKLDAFNWFIRQGYLVPLIPRKPTSMLEVDDVRIQGGEFVQKDLQDAVDQTDITNRVVLEMVELAKYRNHWLIFASGIEHAKHITDTLTTVGISAKVVHSKQTTSERDEAIRAFRNGTIRAIVNNGILTTGFDSPHIDMIAMLRPTRSPGLWVQMLGRGTRPTKLPLVDNQENRLAEIKASEKHNCLVLDFAGNTRRLGPINDPIIPEQKEQGHGEAPVRLCNFCGCYSHASATVCEVCGAEFPRHRKIATGASTVDLLAPSKAAEAAAPVVETFNVDQVTYTRHEKANKPPSMRVTYYCNNRLSAYSEYICFEHIGYAKRKAAVWWIGRSMDRIPETVDEALSNVQFLKQPTKIKVWLNAKHPEILSYEFAIAKTPG
jgi:DNA repair protein RadD